MHGRHFETVASIRHILTLEAINGAVTLARERFVAALPAAGTVVELACGTGRWTPFLLGEGVERLFAVDAAAGEAVLVGDHHGSAFYKRELLRVHVGRAIRKALEPEIAASLAGRLAPGDLAELESTIRIYDHAPANADEQYRQRIAELDFHSQLAQLCPNRLLGFLCGLMHNLLRDLPLALQAKILRALEEKRFERIGGTLVAGPSAGRGWLVTATLPRNGA